MAAVPECRGFQLLECRVIAVTVVKATSAHAGVRLDRFLVARLPQFTRSQIHRWIAEGRVRVDGSVRKPAYVVRRGERIAIDPPTPAPASVLPETIPLDILFEDTACLVVNKPAGMVVHPGAGQARGTLVNALLAHCTDLAGVGDAIRPGIVHRLDKGTSGVMVVAKTHAAHAALVRQFQERRVTKRYLAIVFGRIAEAGRIDVPIGRHPTDRKRMSTRARRSRPAETAWRVREYFGDRAAWLEVDLGTGRTHQIRVHLSAAGHPIVGDAAYGAARALARLPSEAHEALAGFPRPALHAWRLAFDHPATGERLQFIAPIPTDFAWLVERCRMLAAS
ncbi:MAG: RluA family pseudouridine synthase [Deltaproteobacteria bacterium]|nr:RluA family pseudouridine synthase [Deltaproteobacteria bacterium]